MSERNRGEMLVHRNAVLPHLRTYFEILEPCKIHKDADDIKCTGFSCLISNPRTDDLLDNDLHICFDELGYWFGCAYEQRVENDSEELGACCTILSWRAKFTEKNSHRFIEYCNEFIQELQYLKTPNSIEYLISCSEQDKSVRQYYITGESIKQQWKAYLLKKSWLPL